MAADGNEEEPKLTVKLGSDVTEPEPFEYTVPKPASLLSSQKTRKKAT